MTPANREPLVQALMGDGVTFVTVAGQDTSLIEDIIDEACVGDGTQPYSMLTPSHPGKSLAEVIAFAESLGPGIPPCAIVIQLSLQRASVCCVLLPGSATGSSHPADARS